MGSRSDDTLTVEIAGNTEAVNGFSDAVRQWAAARGEIVETVRRDYGTLRARVVLRVRPARPGSGEAG